MTATCPEAPFPTTAVIVVVFTTLNDDAAIPPKVTDVAPVKPVPVIVILVPVTPDVGEKLVITGGARKVNPGRLPVPNGLDTKILPELPAPTIAVIVVELTTVNDAAGVIPNLTAVIPVKFVPIIVTVVPLVALVGVKDVTVGILIKVYPSFLPVP